MQRPGKVNRVSGARDQPVKRYETMLGTRLLGYHGDRHPETVVREVRARAHLVGGVRTGLLVNQLSATHESAPDILDSHSRLKSLIVCSAIIFSPLTTSISLHYSPFFHPTYPSLYYPTHHQHPPPPTQPSGSIMPPLPNPPWADDPTPLLSQDAQTPLFLQQVVPLSSTTWPVWSSQMEHLLRSLGAWSIIQGSISPVDASGNESPASEAAKILLSNYLGYEIGHGRIGDAWRSLKEQFSGGGDVLRVEVGVWREYLACKWEKGESLEEWIERSEGLRKRLNECDEVRIGDKMARDIILAQLPVEVFDRIAGRLSYDSTLAEIRAYLNTSRLTQTTSTSTSIPTPTLLESPPQPQTQNATRPPSPLLSQLPISPSSPHATSSPTRAPTLIPTLTSDQRKTLALTNADQWPYGVDKLGRFRPGPNMCSTCLGTDHSIHNCPGKDDPKVASKLRLGNLAKRGIGPLAGVSPSPSTTPNTSGDLLTEAQRQTLSIPNASKWKYGIDELGRFRCSPGGCPRCLAPNHISRYCPYSTSEAESVRQAALAKVGIEKLDPKRPSSHSSSSTEVRREEWTESQRWTLENIKGAEGWPYGINAGGGFRTSATGCFHCLSEDHFSTECILSPIDAAKERVGNLKEAGVEVTLEDMLKKNLGGSVGVKEKEGRRK